jgi:hypothetical protein
MTITNYSLDIETKLKHIQSKLSITDEVMKDLLYVSFKFSDRLNFQERQFLKNLYHIYRMNF